MRSALCALAYALLCSFGPTQVQAQAPSPGSAACQALNGSTTATISVIVGANNHNGPYSGVLAAGDRVTVTASNFAFGTGTLRVFAPDTLTLAGTVAPATGASVTFTLTTGGQIYLQASAQYVSQFTFACVGTAPAAPTGPTNSEILDQTKQTYSKVGAQASATAMGDAASGAIGDAFSGGGTTQIGQVGFSTNFAALEKTRDERETETIKDDSDPFAALAYKKTRIAYSKVPLRKAPPRLLSQWHVWIDGRYTGFEDKSAVGFGGWHSNITGGASYRFTQNFLAGVIVGYENFKYSVTAAGVPTSLDGNGVSGGGYFGWKFADRLRLDGMLTYGRIDYNAGAGGVVGSFGADRITGMGKLSGRYGMGKFYLEPSSMLTIASERQDSFTDTAAVAHNAFNFTVGRASTGGTVGVPLAWGLVVVTPTFGAFADYRFGDETAAAASVVPTFNNGWSAHVNGGLSVAMPGNVTASATGEYGGLGQNLNYWRAKGSLGVKF